MAKDRDRDRRKGGKSRDDRRRAPKKKTSVLTTDNIQWVDYKDVNLLRRFMSERAKIRARRVTGNSAQQQRAVARAIRVAREMALLPYAVRQVTQRTKGGRGRDRDRGDYRDLPREATSSPSPPTPVPSAPPETEPESAPSEVEAPAAALADESVAVESTPSEAAPNEASEAEATE
jgi:small subunit ribosomal protein S18